MGQIFRQVVKNINDSSKGFPLLIGQYRDGYAWIVVADDWSLVILLRVCWLGRTGLGLPNTSFLPKMHPGCPLWLQCLSKRSSKISRPSKGKRWKAQRAKETIKHDTGWIIRLNDVTMVNIVMVRKRNVGKMTLFHQYSARMKDCVKMKPSNLNKLYKASG